MNPLLHILSTGTELSSGRSTDTNGPYIARKFADCGFRIHGMSILPDNPAVLLETIREIAEKKEISGIVITGGLGPTADDHTIDVLSELTGLPPVEDENALRRLEIVAKRYAGRLRLQDARRQVRILEGSKGVPNNSGLAPGVMIDLKRGERTLLLAAMPGVPQEMKPMFEEHVLPEYVRRFPVSEIYRRIFHIYGVGESVFQAKFFGRGKAAAENEGVVRPDELSDSFEWGITAGAGQIKIFFESKNQSEVDNLYAKAKEAYADSFLPGPEIDLLHELCVERGIKLSGAESCTGGLTAKILTDRPGSSAFFLGSVTAYSNDVKHDILGVSEEILATKGAVSEECAVLMAEGALRVFKTDFAFSITGIAGPDGGTAEKPTGTVFFGLAGRERKTKAGKLFFPMDRGRVREYSAHLVLFHLYKFIHDAS